MQELKTENIIVENGDVTHTFNHHKKLNDLLQRLAIKTKTVVGDAKNIKDFAVLIRGICL